ncbi:putative uncharacterized protein [Janthinobacterium agaricidamnosum NBRC 102515 = DSM 9628]|uniref:Lactate dehydrogenase n=1 Tax=Janthinobacterium agaricidamnosum NBRC 102515 = DSM 9628 TaxID=1349767 RepID=W0V252_9BURK|nr:putative uncharacterized protein [Janthinobacterium agaricidamnosum NBRC 102515 = DSM 9628]
MSWENKSQDKVTAMMAGNFPSLSTAGRFGGLGALLLNQLKDGDVNVSQTVRRLPQDGAAALYGVSGVAPPSALHGRGDNQVSFTVTTASGVKVKLALDSQSDGLAVQMSSSGELSDAERSALAGLADAFQGAIDGMAQGKPQLKLAGLMQFDPKVLASVDLRVAVQLPGQADTPQTLDFHADSTQRKVSFDGPSGKLDVSVDMSKLAGVGGKEQQAKAMASYMKQFDQAASRGHGDAALVSLFKDAFSAVNSNYGAAASGAASGAASETTSGRWPLVAEDRAVLTGLADFSASVSQASQWSNPMRPTESDSFSYEVSQSTTMAGPSQKDRSISQQQKSQLTASYHMPIKPGAKLKLDSTAESQNYDYFQIRDSASSDARVAYKDGRLVKATLAQSASLSSRAMRYEMGKLTSDVTTPGTSSVQRDLIGALAPYQSGAPGDSPQQVAEWRKQTLSTLNDQILLQAYPGQVMNLWAADAPGSAAE